MSVRQIWPSAFCSMFVEICHANFLQSLKTGPYLYQSLYYVVYNIKSTLKQGIRCENVFTFVHWFHTCAVVGGAGVRRGDGAEKLGKIQIKSCVLRVKIQKKSFYHFLNKIHGWIEKLWNHLLFKISLQINRCSRMNEFFPSHKKDAPMFAL